MDVHDFSVEFVTNADGETSALITGVEDENVQESESDEGAPEPAGLISNRNLRQVVFDTVAVTLTKEGHTVDELV